MMERFPRISKNTISGIYNTIKNGFTNAVNFIKNLASSAFSWGADIINGIVNGIKSCIGMVKDAVSSGNGGSGDIVIPVYLGGTMLDEVIVNAQRRANLRSGGR